jgi:hypothetical protein
VKTGNIGDVVDKGGVLFLIFLTLDFLDNNLPSLHKFLSVSPLAGIFLRSESTK